MARKAAVEVSADFSEVGFTMGLLSGMSTEVRTNRYLGDVISYVHRQLADEFDVHMDFAVEAFPRRFSHVYEWNNNPGDDRSRDRLWEHRLLGSGGTRNATFTWKASVRPIPTPQERARNSDDPISLVPPEELAKLSNRRYIFYWKAPIMEYDTGVNIRPKYAKALFIPTGNPANPFVFANEFRNLQPGGEASTGQFTTEWVNWWGNQAPESFDKNLREGLERDLAGVTNGIRQGQRTRSGKRIGLAATSDYAAAFESGETWAKEYMRKNANKYKARGKT
jgi:hypothetical protein